MVNTRNKGNRARRKAIQTLESDGFTVAVVERTGKFIKDKDAFGVGDLLAIQSGFSPLLVQVTCNKPHTHKAYKEFSKQFFPKVQLIQMVWVDGKGFRNFIYDKEGRIKKVDMWVDSKV